MVNSKLHLRHFLVAQHIQIHAENPYLLAGLGYVYDVLAVVSSFPFWSLGLAQTLVDAPAVYDGFLCFHCEGLGWCVFFSGLKVLKPVQPIISYALVPGTILTSCAGRISPLGNPLETRCFIRISIGYRLSLSIWHEFIHTIAVIQQQEWNSLCSIIFICW